MSLVENIRIDTDNFGRKAVFCRFDGVEFSLPPGMTKPWIFEAGYVYAGGEKPGGEMYEPVEMKGPDGDQITVCVAAFTNNPDLIEFYKNNPDLI